MIQIHTGTVGTVFIESAGISGTGYMVLIAKIAKYLVVE
jgi:hypothetical protein